MSRRFNVAVQLGGLRDVAPFSDPFDSGRPYGLSAMFHIRREGCEAVRQADIAASKADPLEQAAATKFLSRLQQELSKPKGSEEQNPEAEQGHWLADGGATLGLEVAIDHGLTLTEINGRKRSGDIDRALVRLDRWENFPDSEGNAIPFSPEVARELLLCDEDLPEESAVYGGDGKRPEGVATLGEFYTWFILTRSSEKAVFYSNLLEAAAKNSETSSGGSDSPGDVIA
jgi:hypothetical protein